MATSPLHESYYGQCNTSNSFFLGADDESEREDLDDGVSHHFHDARRSEFSNEINTGYFSPTAAQSEISYSDSGSERYDIIKQLPDSTSVINGFFNRIQSIPDFPTAKFKIYNDYIFGACLGQGSYGKVKEVLHSQTLTRYAVKIFSYQKLRKIPRWEKIMKNELKVLKKLNHENVISLQDHFYRPEKKKTYYIFEFCVTNMQEMLSHSTEGRFPEVQARYYFLQLIKGLSYLQSVRVVHKDIKPANLLISSSHQLKIGDFGTAEVLDIFADDGICTSVEGTPQFQSPEIAKPEDTYDGYASDIWAAGVTLYNMTTGQYPFRSDENQTIYALYKKIEAYEYIAPDNGWPSIDLKTLVDAMLAYYPTDRPECDQILDFKWAKIEYDFNIIEYLQDNIYPLPSVPVNNGSPVKSEISITSSRCFSPQSVLSFNSTSILGTTPNFNDLSLNLTPQKSSTVSKADDFQVSIQKRRSSIDSVDSQKSGISVKKKLNKIIRKLSSSSIIKRRKDSVSSMSTPSKKSGKTVVRDVEPAVQFPKNIANFPRSITILQEKLKDISGDKFSEVLRNQSADSRHHLNNDCTVLPFIVNYLMQQHREQFAEETFEDETSPTYVPNPEPIVKSYKSGGETDFMKRLNNSDPIDLDIPGYKLFEPHDVSTSKESESYNKETSICGIM